MLRGKCATLLRVCKHFAHKFFAMTIQARQKELAKAVGLKTPL